MITLDDISKKIGGRTLFENVSASFVDSCRYGLTGPNGSGKSTLLKIMMKEADATSGSVHLPKKVGFLRQNIQDFLEFRVIDTVIMGNTRLWQAFEDREKLYQMEMTDAVGLKIGSLEEIVAEEDGYMAEPEAEELLLGMGVMEELYFKKMKEIPADQQFRVLLCQALFGHPEALLLDEPTNHLDLESIGWLEKFLKNYNGILITVSHDRHFLNGVCNHIADIDYDTIIIYPGNYDDMVMAKTQGKEKTEAENKNKEKKISQLREFVSRFSAGTRASQVKSRLKEIQRLQPQELKKSNINRPYIRILPHEKQSGKIVLKVKKLSHSYGENQVLKDLNFEIHNHDKIAVIGNNGQGKSTLLKLLDQTLKPTSGSVDYGHQIKMGYFPQNHEDIIDKKSSESLFDYLKFQKPGVYDQEIRSVLGKMLFGGDDAFKTLKALSGGETARLIIASLMLTTPNFLILDEPNNHLDIEAVSALAWGLEEYKGTVIFASHDRDLIDSVATKIFYFENHQMHIFDGPYAEYLEKQKANS